MTNQHTRAVLSGAVGAATSLVGRKRAARMARWLTNEIRFDQPNNLEVNGEQYVQRKALTPGTPVVFDVGCHFGEWSQSLLNQAATRNRNGRDAVAVQSHPRVFAFEPSAYSYEMASKNLAGRASVFRMALSSQPGRMALNIVHDGAGSNSLTPFSTDVTRASGRTEEVSVETADRFAEEHEVEAISLLKIDAEGHDLAVIRGAQSLLERKAVGLLQFEYNARWIDSRSFLLDAFELVLSAGYQIGKVTRAGIETYDGWHPELETFREGNYLAFLPQRRAALITMPWWNI